VGFMHSRSFHLLMPTYVCSQWSGEPQSMEGQQGLAWVAARELSDFEMPEADYPLIGAPVHLVSLTLYGVDAAWTSTDASPLRRQVRDGALRGARNLSDVARARVSAEPIRRAMAAASEQSRSCE
jgi:hypothetical protein